MLKALKLETLQLTNKIKTISHSLSYFLQVLAPQPLILISSVLTELLGSMSHLYVSFQVRYGYYQSTSFNII